MHLAYDIKLLSMLLCVCHVYIYPIAQSAQIYCLMDVEGEREQPNSGTSSMAHRATRWSLPLLWFVEVNCRCQICHAAGMSKTERKYIGSDAEMMPSKDRTKIASAVIRKTHY